LAQELEARKDRVALVEVIDVDALAEGLKQADAADPEENLLSEAIFHTATVEALRDPTVFVALGLDEVERRRDVAVDIPGPARHALATDCDFDPHIDTAQRVARRLGIVVLDSRVTDDLTGVPLVPEQADTGQRDLQVADRLHVVARENA
jgi:hypothetical protein